MPGFPGERGLAGLPVSFKFCPLIVKLCSQIVMFALASFRECPDLKEKWVLLVQLARQETKDNRVNLARKDHLVLKEEQVNRELLDRQVPKVTR